MTPHPVDELIDEIGSYVERKRTTLPATEIRLLERALDHLRLYRTEERNGKDGKSVHVVKAIYWLTAFFTDCVTDCELPEPSELLDAVKQLL